MSLWLLLAVLVVMAVAAPRYGVDSRRLAPGEGPGRRGPTPWGDLVALVAAVRRTEVAAGRQVTR